ncbi:MAG: hypothetical protein V7641_2420 [Blastocatellia bacterium]
MKRLFTLMVLPALIAVFVASSLRPARAEIQDRLFDFNDNYYRQNGVDPDKIQGRRNGTDGRSVFDAPYFPYQRNVRALRLNPAYANNGALLYWTVMGDLFVSGFTNDAAGRRAKQIGDSYIEYVFPRRNQPDPVPLGANRQADILDTRNGYFSNDPLGLWLHVWVSYTDRAFNTADGRKALSDLARKNGLALDGTPIIKTLSDLENLFSKGFAAKRFRNPDGSEGPMYGICPVVKDPTNGGIAPDNVLTQVRQPDGTPLEPDFLRNFLSLQTTWRWAN